MKQTQPADNGGGTPVLALQAQGRRWRLYQSNSSGPSSYAHQLWSAPARKSTWTRFVFDVTYAIRPLIGSVKVYADLNRDGDALDAGEQSPTIHTYTLKRESATNPFDGVTDDGIAAGQPIPSHLRVGLYHDRPFRCQRPRGCRVDIDNVQVIDPAS